jgi:hypothetical protein
MDSSNLFTKLTVATRRRKSYASEIGYARSASILCRLPLFVIRKSLSERRMDPEASPGGSPHSPFATEKWSLQPHNQKNFFKKAAAIR